MRGKPGYEHLNEPLHILIEAELPVEIIDARLIQARDVLQDLLKPVVNSSALLPACIIWLKQYIIDIGHCGWSSLHLLFMQDECQDFYKKQQLRELAMLNGTLRDESSPMSGSVSPFNTSLGMKRAKTRGWLSLLAGIWILCELPAASGRCVNTSNRPSSLPPQISQTSPQIWYVMCRLGMVAYAKTQ